MPDPITRVTLDLFGTPIAFDADVAEQLHGLPRSSAEPIGIAKGSTAIGALSDATQLAVVATPLLVLHCGLVAAPSGLIAIPGRSGAGKSTLVAALVKAGFGYLTDEAIGVDRAAGYVSPLTRPLSLSRASLAALDLDAPEDPALEELLLAGSELGSIATVDGPITDVLLIDRHPGSARLELTERSAAIVELVSRGVNHYRSPTDSFRLIARLVRAARVWSIRYEEAPDAARLCADHWLRPT